jgi:hypothetical protein
MLCLKQFEKSRALKYVSLAALVSLLNLTACSKSKDKAEDPYVFVAPSKLAKIDITNASQLFVTGTNTTGLLADNTALKPSTLYKVTPEGVVHEVSYLDETGAVTTTYDYPVKIDSPDERYATFQFSSGVTYLVRKDDGKAYILGDAAENFPNGIKPITNLKKDLASSGDDLAFWGNQSTLPYNGDPTSNQTIIKGVFRDGNIEKQIVSASGEGSETFSMDKNGNLIYLSAAYGQGTARFRTGAGTFLKLADVSSFWTTSEGHIVTVANVQQASMNAVKDMTTDQVLTEHYNGDKVFWLSNTLPAKIEIFRTDGIPSSDPQAFCASTASAGGCFGYTTTITLSSSDAKTAISEITAAGVSGLTYDDTGVIVQSAPNTMGYYVFGGTSFWSKSTDIRFDNYSFATTNGHSGLPFACRSGRFIAQFNAPFLKDYRLLTLIDETNFALTSYLFLGGTKPVCTSSSIYAVGIDENIYQFDMTTRTSKKIVVENVLEVTGLTFGGGETLSVQGKLNDGSAFLGNVDATGQLKILSRISTGQITIITPLN